MVLTVVSAHSGSSNEKRIVKLIREIANDAEMPVRTEIAGVSLGHSDNNGVKEIFFINNADFGCFINGQSYEFSIGRVP